MSFHIEYLNYYFEEIHYFDNDYGLYYCGAIFEILIQNQRFKLPSSKIILYFINTIHIFIRFTVSKKS